MWDLRQVRNFVVVAERLNMSRAAEVLNVSQSALSRQIQSLENEAGVPLFDRVGKRLVLTSEGEHLLPGFADLVRQAETLSRRAKAVSQGHVGFLKVGATPQTIAALLSDALAVFRPRHPGVEVTLVEGHNDHLITLVQRGTVNLAVAALPTHCDLVGEKLFTARLWTLLPPGDPREDREWLSVEDLSGDALLTLRKGFLTRELLERAYRRAGLQPRILLESDSPATVAALAEAGHGCAILSSSAVAAARDRRLIPLVSNREPIEQDVLAVWDPGRHQVLASSLFLPILREAAARALPQGVYPGPRR